MNGYEILNIFDLMRKIKNKPEITVFKLFKISLVFFILAIIIACNPTKLVPEDKYLLNKVSIKCDNKNIAQEELKSYIKQKPNRKILEFFRFHLTIYHIATSGKERKWKNKIGKIVGEEPVVWDNVLTKKTVRQLKLYLKNKAYCNASVKDSIRQLTKKKVNVYYIINTNKPYIIRNIDYNIDDYNISSIILKDTVNSLLKRNVLFDVDILQAERTRLSNLLKNSGYYYFSKEYIYYQADSSLSSNQIDISIGIKKHIKKLVVNQSDSIQYNPDIITAEDHRKYKINNIFIYTDYDPKKALLKKSDYYKNFDTLVYKGFYFIYNDKIKIKHQLIVNANYIINDELYNLYNVEQTYKHLTSLRIFKLINIQFFETRHTNRYNNAGNLLDCHIQLTPLTKQSYTVELEGTNSSGNIGGAGNLIYQHKSLFGSAEIFDLKFKGALEMLKDTTGQLNTTVEYGAEARIDIHKFLLPFRSGKFTKRYNPKTTISLAYNYQQRPDYTRKIANLSFGYYWKGSDYVRHIINPIEINSVILSDCEEFIDRIEGTSLENSFKDHLISATNYSFIYNNQDIKKHRNFVYFRTKAEFAGNYLFSQTRYAQYLKADFDFRYYNILNKANNFVYRAFLGAGTPYGNSKDLPFEKQYFSGGANSIRAWQVRSIGPGSYNDTLQKYPNQLANFKLEANIEYRFDLFWLIEGAIFVDAGNIWATNQVVGADSVIQQSAVFKFDKFYKEIAIGTGFGIRFDFSFFVFRFDLGIKIRDPKEPEENRWILGARKLKSDDYMLNVGIGYPF